MKRSLLLNPQPSVVITNTATIILITTSKTNSLEFQKYLNICITPGGQQGRCEVEVSIFGENQYPPILDEEEYTISVNENALPPKSLLTVSATDQDTMYFGEVSFTLTFRYFTMF